MQRLARDTDEGLDERARETLAGRARVFDAIFLTIIVIGSWGWCWAYRPNWFVANVLLIGAPLVYLLVRSARARRNMHALFIFKYIVFACVAFSYLCVRYGGWKAATIFPWRLPGGVAIEEIQWNMLIIPLVIAANEHFFATPRVTPPRRGVRTVMAAMFFTGFAIVLVPQLQSTFGQYVYAKVGLALYPPVLFLSVRVNRGVLRDLTLTALVFTPYNLASEILGLRNGYWVFRGTYLKMIPLFGYQFPLEECLFYILLCAPAIVATYSLYKNWKFPFPGGPHVRTGEPRSALHKAL
jgi:hypothetical protein